MRFYSLDSLLMLYILGCLVWRLELLSPNVCTILNSTPNPNPFHKILLTTPKYATLHKATFKLTPQAVVSIPSDVIGPSSGTRMLLLWHPGQLWTTSWAKRSQSMQKWFPQAVHSYRLLALIPLEWFSAVYHWSSGGTGGNWSPQAKQAELIEARLHGTSTQLINGKRWW